MKQVFLLLLSCLFAQGLFADQRPVLSLVIDDLGYSLARGKHAIDLEGDHTYAIIPGTTYGNKLAKFATGKHKEIILHLPMQAMSERSAMEPNALNEAMDEDAISENLQLMLAEFPHIKGVNNHMGSHMTSINYFMKPIMDGIRAYDPDLYFLDSRTTASSIAFIEARRSGLSSIKRDVFLDHQANNLESLKLQFQIWLQKARDRGTAIAIGHPHPTTIDFLKQQLPALKEQFQFFSISKLLHSMRDDSVLQTSQNSLAN